MFYRLSILVILFITSCQNPKQEHIKSENISSVRNSKDVININLDTIEYEDNISLSMFFNSVKYIPLETTTKSLLVPKTEHTHPLRTA